MPIRLVIFDFDGTLTRIEAEAAHFLGGYRADVLGLFGEARAAAWDAQLAATGAAAPELGWNLGTGEAAPADADPYIQAGMAFPAFCVAQKLPVVGEDSDASRALRGQIGQTLFTRNYPKETSFRADAAATMKAASERAMIRIVTNSQTDKVATKLKALGLTQAVGVVGDARKFEVSEPTQRGFGLSGVPPKWWVQGLARPLQPRRGRYFDALAELWRETGTTPAETLVVGDIPELDLLLPGLLGCHVHYLRRAKVHAYEEAMLAAFGSRAASSDALADILARLD